jgi:hypothetical protein
MLSGRFGGSCPSTRTFPLISPAVAMSTFFASGAAAGADGSADLFCPPPHAAATMKASETKIKRPR